MVMASKLLRILPVGRRGFSAQVAAARSGQDVVPSSQNQILASKVENGVTVVSLDTASPLSRVAIAFRGGARYESEDNRGVTHLLRVAASLSNEDNSSFLLTNKLQQLGSSMNCSVDREGVVYSVTSNIGHLEQSLELLAGAATKQSCFYWEIRDQKPAVVFDTQTRSSFAALMDDLHRAAFRHSPLSHQLYSTPAQLAGLDSDSVKSHLADTLLPSNTFVIGVGVDHAFLCDYAAALPLSGDKAAPKVASHVLGGEVRCEVGGDTALVAVAGAGAPANSKESAAFSVLQALFGSGSLIMHGGCNGLLGEAAVKNGASALALGAVYSDAALSGYCVAASSGNIGAVVKNVHQVFKSAKFTADHLARGKAMARASILQANSCSSVMLDSLIHQAINGSQVETVDSLDKAIESVTLSQLQQAHKSLLSGKLAMASYGNLSSLPYLDEL